MSIVATNSIVY